MSESEFYINPNCPFTPRQREVLELILQGFHRREIAKILGRSEHTIRNLICGYNDATPGQKGILGLVDDLSGQRPRTASPEFFSLLKEAGILMENPAA